MTATDELCKLLDERGVEYMEGHGYREFFWDFGESGRARASAIGTKGLVQMIVTGITPEQAIAATLGPREQPPYDELIEALRRDWDIEASWDGLRRFWYVGLTDEGVRKRDEREATLGRGECHEVIVDEYWRGCGNCGYVWEYMYGIGKCTRPNFCPRCGAKVPRIGYRATAEALRADSSPDAGETE